MLHASIECILSRTFSPYILCYLGSLVDGSTFSRYTRQSLVLLLVSQSDKQHVSSVPWLCLKTTKSLGIIISQLLVVANSSTWSKQEGMTIVCKRERLALYLGRESKLEASLSHSCAITTWTCALQRILNRHYVKLIRATILCTRSTPE